MFTKRDKSKKRTPNSINPDDEDEQKSVNHLRRSKKMRKKVNINKWKIIAKVGFLCCLHKTSD